MGMRIKKTEGESQLSYLEREALDDSERWFGDIEAVKNLPYHTLCLAGEVGELANIVKKIQRGSLDIRTPEVRYNLAMETTDAFVYLLNVAGLLGIDLEQSNQIVRAKNDKRFLEERKNRERKNNGSQL